MSLSAQSTTPNAGTQATEDETEIVVRFSEESRQKQMLILFDKGMRVTPRTEDFSTLLSSFLANDCSQIHERDYSPIYIAMANEETRVQRESMNAFMSNDREAAWDCIAEGYHRCPLLILRKAFV